MIDRRRFLGGCVWCAALGAISCAAPPPAPTRVTPGHRPAHATDEAGLWQIMDQEEASISRSAFRIRDEAANRLLRDVVCRLAADYCRDVRVYVLRTPHFNASMAPNGMMQVWTGLLLRVENEAQLAAVIGHELGHYLQQHTLQRWRDARQKSDIAAFAGIGLALAGAGIAANLADVVALASIFAYGRDQEREADAIGVELMAKAGYRPIQAAEVWAGLLAEEAAQTERAGRDLVFASHPQPEERLDSLRDKAAILAAPNQDDHAGRFHAAMSALRPMLLQDEMRLRRYERFLVLLDRLEKAPVAQGDLLFYRGEVYRLRDAQGDRPRAIAAFQTATNQAGHPVETWRSLGLVLRAEGNRAAANAAFTRYLENAPAAIDRDLVRSYIEAAS